MLVTHMLRSVGEDPATHKRVLTTRCGMKRPQRSADRMPADVTGWETKVTCPECVLEQA